jgi:hypothetical protein
MQRLIMEEAFPPPRSDLALFRISVYIYVKDSQLLTSMNKKQWDRARHLTLLMHEVNVEPAMSGDSNGKGVHRKSVDHDLSLAPIVVTLPPGDQTPEMLKRKATGVPHVLKFVREDGESQASTQNIDGGVGNSKGEWLWLFHL